MSISLADLRKSLPRQYAALCEISEKEKSSMREETYVVREIDKEISSQVTARIKMIRQKNSNFIGMVSFSYSAEVYLSKESSNIRNLVLRYFRKVTTPGLVPGISGPVRVFEDDKIKIMVTRQPAPKVNECVCS